VISATAPNVIGTSDQRSSDQSNRTQTDRTLVERARSGDHEAFAELFQTHKKRVYSVCLLMTKDVAEAEDLTQEAFLQVFRTSCSRLAPGKNRALREWKRARTIT
jgi:DNA-directed RNA polymerase specialized sigma24 family protein